MDSQESVVYQIPIYQRNYAWEEDEITALIKDVYDSSKKDAKAPYYIGTLVTYKRGDNNYEVIDGQQRLTTIYIILKALGIDQIRNKLTYTARKLSADTIEKMPVWGEESDPGIKLGFEYAKKALDEIVENDYRQKFEKYLLDNVHIIHYKVPKDVDLNHYFEVMNSRGEQLEKHEIVKSMLGQCLDSKDLTTFSRIWEACSEMGVYIQQKFPCADVFGTKLNTFVIDYFEEIPVQDATQGKATIEELINSPIGKGENTEDEELSDKFQSIIDFPNFLLIVLKLTKIFEKSIDIDAIIDFSLDDKELINEFTKAIKNSKDKKEFAKGFVFNLLRCRYLLDNYTVHHTLSDKEQNGDNPWQLQYYVKENAKNKHPKNLSDNSDIQVELVHLLSMLEVTFTPKQRKNYLFYCLLYLTEDPNNWKPGKYLEFLQKLAHKFFYDVYLDGPSLSDKNQPAPNAFDKVVLDENGYLVLDLEETEEELEDIFNAIYEEGSANIPLYVFNFMDYKLWKKYADTLRGNKSKKGSKDRTAFFEELGCSDFELDPFNNFYFSRTRKSLEHYYPQSKAGKDQPLSKTDINCFGNFAMISSEANSSGNNWDPKTKLDHYSDRKADQVSVASLKFKIMMQICKDNNKAMLNGDLNRDKWMEWNKEDIDLHQEKMLKIIFE